MMRQNHTARLRTMKVFTMTGVMMTALGVAIAVLVPLATAAHASLSAVGMAIGGALAASAIALALAWREALRKAGRVERFMDSLDSLVAVAPGRSSDEQPGGDWLVGAEARLRAAIRTIRTLTVEQKQTQALLTAQSQERADFFSKLSHELRSPLNAILGYSAILLEDHDADHEANRTDLRRIREAGQSLLNLIDDLLDQAQDKLGRNSLEHLPFDLHALIERVAAQGAPGECTVRTASSLRDNQRIVFGNREKIARAVSGLIDQCARLAPAGTIDIHVAPATDRPGFMQLCFNVAPVEITLAEDVQNSAALVNDGLVSSVGGEVAITQPAAHALRYEFALPIDNRKQGADFMGPDMQTTSTMLSSDARLALIIDDDPAAIDLLSRWVRRCGYRVATASNGADGLERAQEEQPDIVLLDALMPGLSGYDILPSLRQLPNMQCVPILMVTVDDDRVRGLDVGATDVVRKPITESQLRSLIAIYEEPRAGDILIIDDDEDAVEILDRTIRRLGFTPRRAANGEEGLAAVRQSAPKAILLDLNMPKVNGFEFIEALSHDRQLAAIPLIVVSGAELSAPQHTKLVEAGVRYFLKGSAAPREIAEGVWKAVA